MQRIMATESEIGKALKGVLKRIESASEKRSSVNLPRIPTRLVAVSKTKPVRLIQEAYQNNHRHFGENYVQELVDKSIDDAIVASCPDIRWHFIGHLQSNKVKKLLKTNNLFMVETIDSEKIATELNKHWNKEANGGQRLKVMVQINTSQEENKSGITPENFVDLVKYVMNECPNLDLAGLMTIGSFNHDLSQGPNPDFQVLVRCRSEMSDRLSIPVENIELSMGMSNDFEHAIEVGSTNVRVGSTIFGARNYPNKNTNPDTESK